MAVSFLNTLPDACDASEASIPPSPATLASRSVLGFSVRVKSNDPETADESTTKSANKWKAELEGLGLTPLRILDRETWRKKTQDAGWYRFEHLDEDGWTGNWWDMGESLASALLLFAYNALLFALVFGAITLFAEPPTAVLWVAVPAIFGVGLGAVRFALTKGAGKETFWAAFIFCALVLTAGAGAGGVRITDVTNLFGATMMFVVYAGVIVCGFIIYGLAEVDKVMLRPFKPLVIRLLPKNTLLRFLFPYGSDHASQEGRLRVRFPEADSTGTFAKYLLRAEEAVLDPKIAAHPDAIADPRRDLLGMVDENTRFTFPEDAPMPLLYIEERIDNIPLVAVLAELTPAKKAT